MPSSTNPGEARLRVEAVDDGSAARITIHGEADVTDVDHLKSALESIHLDGAESVQLHVSDLTFVDAAALRQLATFAHHVREGGRTVTTLGARPTLQRMVLALDVQDELGLP